MRETAAGRTNWARGARRAAVRRPAMAAGEERRFVREWVCRNGSKTLSSSGDGEV